MNLGGDVAKALADVREEWNNAEGAIKIAEQVSGKIIDPAIYELRYAGRRIVEAMALNAGGNPTDALKRLQDAHFDCCRARHDAIDAASSKIAADLDIATKKLGAEILLTNFPRTTEIYKQLDAIRRRIVISRKNREDRNAIYAVLQASNLEGLVDLYGEFQASEPLMIAAARRQRHQRYLNYGIGIAGAVLAAIGLMV
jgi:hypothetical protein